MKIVVLSCTCILLHVLSYNTNAQSIAKNQYVNYDTIGGKVYSVTKFSKYKSIIYLKDSLNRNYQVVYHNIRKKPTYLEVGKNLINNELLVIGKKIKNSSHTTYINVNRPEHLNIKNIPIPICDMGLNVAEISSLPNISE